MLPWPALSYCRSSTLPVGSRSEADFECSVRACSCDVLSMMIDCSFPFSAHISSAAVPLRVEISLINR